MSGGDEDPSAGFEQLEGREADDAFMTHLAQCVRGVRPEVTPEELTRALAAALAQGSPSPAAFPVQHSARRGLSFLVRHGSKIWGVTSVLHAAGVTGRRGRAMARRVLPLVLLMLTG